MNIPKIDYKSNKLTGRLRKHFQDGDLWHKLNSCGHVMNANGYQFRYSCRSLSCDFCRRKAIKQMELEAQRLFSKAPENRLFFLTICLPPAQSLDRLGYEIRTAKRDLRNLVARWRTSHTKANNCRMFGAIEIDYCPVDDYIFLGYDKVKQINFYGVDPIEPHIFLPHFHVILDTGGANTSNLMDLLKKKWPAPRACHITPLAAPITKSIEQIVYYITKMSHIRTINRINWDNSNFTVDEFIPVNVLCKLYKWLDINHNFQLLKVHVRPVGSRDNIEKVKSRHAQDSCGYSQYPQDEPLPISF